nr:MAG TPA: hypothetical protein [Caudoviricetes sp.]
MSFSSSVPFQTNLNLYFLVYTLEFIMSIYKYNFYFI